VKPKPCAPEAATFIEGNFQIFQLLSKALVAEEDMRRWTLTRHEEQLQPTLPKSVRWAKTRLSMDKQTTLPTAGAGRGAGWSQHGGCSRILSKVKYVKH